MDRRAEEGQGLSGDMTSTRGSGRPSKSRDEAGPLAELLSSKLRCPLIRPETVYRCSLIEQLAREDSYPIVSVAAPLGSGRQGCWHSGWSTAARPSRGCRSTSGITTEGLAALRGAAL